MIQSQNFVGSARSSPDGIGQSPEDRRYKALASLVLAGLVFFAASGATFYLMILAYAIMRAMGAA